MKTNNKLINILIPTKSGLFDSLKNGSNKVMGSVILWRIRHSVRIICIVACCLSSIVSSFSQPPGEWTWMHGDSTPNSPGVFGTQGVPGATNKPPAVYEPCEWRDNNGNFWLFGGVNMSNGNQYSALWKYDVTTNQWTWIKGSSAVNQLSVYGTQSVPSPANFPGARAWGVVTWTDISGNLWLFGGQGYAATGGRGELNDLWKYDIAANEWTWMKGTNIINDPGAYGTQGVSNPANLPPSRDETSCSWTDATGNLWLYGGRNFVVKFGDLWKYDISTNEWTWMHGANTGNAPAVYGTMGVANPVNTPGARYVYASWTGLTGDLWLFGGITSGFKNDLWKYDIAANQWTWMKSPSTVNDPGNYGTKCVTANNNIPPANAENRSRVIDNCGNFWNFGGGPGYRNDLWHYNVSSSQWTWVSGDNTPNQAAVFGTQGTSSPGNKPGGKQGSVGWMDNNGYIWIFGGSGNGGQWNDLFRYVPSCPCNSPSLCSCSTSLLATATAVNVLCNGQCTGTAAAVATGGSSPYTYQWSSGQTTQTITGLCVGNYTITVTDSTSGISTATITITQPTVLTASITSTSAVCGSNNGSVTVTAGGGTLGYTYSWDPSGQTTSTAAGLGAGAYTATVTDANGCTTTQTGMVVSSGNITTNQFVSICQGSTYTLPGGTVVSIGSIYIDTLTSAGGCDSIITTTLTMDSLFITNQSASICSGFTYTLPGGTIVSTGGTYIDTLTSVAGCDSIITTTLTVDSVFSVSQSAGLCSGSAYTLPGGTVVNSGGIYNDTLTSVVGCDSIITTTLTVNPNPMATAFSNVTITQGQNVTLMASGGGTYSWSNGINGSSIIVTPLVTTIYCVTVTDANNCTDIACVTVTIEQIDCSLAGELYLPNAFSPNGDGENDNLQIYYGNIKCIQSFNLVIYNRWGEKVFETTNPIAEWDGSFRGQIEGTAVFVYYMQAALITGQEIIQKGNISLIR